MDDLTVYGLVAIYVGVTVFGICYGVYRYKL